MNNTNAISQLPIVEESIHKEAIIPCPAVRFAPRRAVNCCPKCERFEGIARMGHDGPWDKQFVIRCGHMIERRTQIINVIEE